MPPHIRREYLIHYVLAGRGRFHTPQRDYAIEPGDLFLIYPQQTVSYETDFSDPLHFSWFSFSGRRAQETAEKLGFSQNACVRHLHSRFSIQEKIMECIALLESGSVKNRFLITAYLYEILSMIYESYLCDDRAGVEQRNIIQEHVHKSISFMKMNYMRPIGVGDVVEFAGLERTYFSKIFHQYTHRTPQQYLMEVRLEQARQLLEKTTYAVKEISSFVGFTDECYFSRAFRKQMGVSPHRFRQMSK